MPNVLFFSLFSYIKDYISLAFKRMYNFQYCFKIHRFICCFMQVDTLARTLAGIDVAIGVQAAINLGAKRFPCVPILLKSMSIRCPSYIDDISLLVVGDSPQQNCALLEEGVTTCFNWGKDNAVAFDDPKSELMHFYNTWKEIIDPYVNVVLPNR